MESPRDTPGMQPGETPWHEFFPTLSFSPHLGQRLTYESAANDPVGDRLIVLPTGYGKTRAAAGYYTIRRAQGAVDRCLWLVSSDEQRKQLSPKTDEKTGHRAPAVSDLISAWFGLPCADTATCSGMPREVVMHYRGLAEIFVSSYQLLRTQFNYFNELMNDGHRWLVIADEAHHLAADKPWGKWLESLPKVETLYMTATPLRTDRIALHNVPDQPAENGARTYAAAVEIPWQQAINEQVVRQPRAHAQEWGLEFKDRQGKLVKLTTSELRDLSKKEGDFDEWVVKRDLRYTMHFLQKIIADAQARLSEKRAQWPGQYQMVVFAMGCTHAKFLANEVFPKGEADWIGVGPWGRSDAVNDVVMKRYKSGELQTLVQVDKAGEGFDHPPTAVLLFLNMIVSKTKLLQQLGRGMRRNFQIPFEQDELDVFADQAHGVIDVVRKLEPDGRYKKEKESGGGDPPGPPGIWCEIPEWVEIVAQWLRTDQVVPEGRPQYPPGVIKAAEQMDLPPERVQQIVSIAQGGDATEAAPTGEVARQAIAQDRVNRLLGLVTSHVIVIATRLGDTDAKSLSGLVKKNLNYEWKAEHRNHKGHDEMLSSDFEEKYTWLRNIDEGMRTSGKVPPWLVRKW